MSFSRLAAIAALLAGALTVLVAAPAGAATAIDLGTARSFAVLAGSGITNTGPTRITGDVGSFGSSDAITGFQSVTLIGVNHGGDAVTQQAKDDLTTAYNQAFASGPPTDLMATELGGRTLTPGVYHHPTLGLTGALTLDTQGDPNAVFVFQADSTLITAAASSVEVLGGATACNVFWQVGSSATFGKDTAFVGNVLAAESISATRGATFEGRLLAQVGAVTLIQNRITATTCAAAVTPVTTPTTVAAPVVTTPVAATAETAATPVAIPAAVAPPAPDATPAPARTTAQTTRTTSRPAGGTTTGAVRPPLAATGPLTDVLPLAGATTIALGLLLVRMTRPLPALRHAVPRRGRIPFEESTGR